MGFLRAAGVGLVFAAIGPVAGLAQFYVLFAMGVVFAAVRESRQ